MDVLTGVSGSMEANVDNGGIGQSGLGGSWAKSIIKLIDRLIVRDASSQHQVFAIEFGASCRLTTFDVLTTLKKLKMEISQEQKSNIINREMGIWSSKSS